LRIRPRWIQAGGLHGLADGVDVAALERRDMAWSVNRDGILTQFDEKTKRVKQINYLRSHRVRFSRQKFPNEAAAVIAFDRQKVAFDTWPPLIQPKGLLSSGE